MQLYKIVWIKYLFGWILIPNANDSKKITENKQVRKWLVLIVKNTEIKQQNQEAYTNHWDHK